MTKPLSRYHGQFRIAAIQSCRRPGYRCIQPSYDTDNVHVVLLSIHRQDWGSNTRPKWNARRPTFGTSISPSIIRLIKTVLGPCNFVIQGINYLQVQYRFLDTVTCISWKIVYTEEEERLQNYSRAHFVWVEKILYRKLKKSTNFRILYPSYSFFSKKKNSSSLKISGNFVVTNTREYTRNKKSKEASRLCHDPIKENDTKNFLINFHLLECQPSNPSTRNLSIPPTANIPWISHAL